MSESDRTMTVPHRRLEPPPTRYVEVLSPGAPSPFRAREGVVRVGRDVGNEIVINDPFVSRVHIEIRIYPHGVEVVDLDTKNGTHYQGARIRELKVNGEVSLMLGKQVTISVRVGDDAPFSDVTAPAIAAPPPTIIPTAPPPAARPAPRGERTELIGESAAMQRLRAGIAKMAPSHLTVLIEGETGTGKEVIARALHQQSPRAGRPLVVFDCAAVSPNLIASELFGHVKGAFTGAVGSAEGAFRRADGGTLFLDEIGELPLDLQPALLRALEARQVKPVGGDGYRAVDVRVVAATNRGLEAEVQAGRFRQDLLFRLAVGRIKVPPLRSRVEDIPALAQHFARAVGGATLAPAVLAALASRPWRGNVRELRNVIERAVMLSPTPLVTSLDDDDDQDLVMPETLRAALGPAASSGDAEVPFQDAKQAAVERFERDYLLKLFERSGCNLSEAARRSGVDRRYLRELFKKHNLDPTTLRAQRRP
ncbi:MAG: sigma-54 dependent transcriptional regulator, Fis family [Myxococcaceae bacterium]|nr:sigma-54 dependent transcriptional regulator, Fis family [Myxococcaceae bacterium]